MSLWKPLIIYGEYIGLVGRFEHICERARRKDVLHVGCSDFPISLQRIKKGQLLHAELAKVTKSLMGVDVSEEGINLLKKEGFTNVEVFDAENMQALGMKFDMIIAGDVLEHMTNPASFLESVKKCLKPDGELLIGLPNTYSWHILRYFLGHEPSHFDHCYSFTVKTIAGLCARFNLIPVELAFTAQPSYVRKRKYILFCRGMLIKLFPRMAPSFLMIFKDRNNINTSGLGNRFLWK